MSRNSAHLKTSKFKNGSIWINYQSIIYKEKKIPKKSKENALKKQTKNLDMIIDKDVCKKIFKELKLTGLQLHLAENSLLIIENDKQNLLIDEKKKDIYPPSCISDFVKHISN